jgi:uncharacterized LabA/DUF88 family protein
MEIKYLFVDGACLRELLESFSMEYFNGDKIDFSYSKLSCGFHKVFYYDALPYKKDEENESDYEIRIKPNIDLFNVLSLLNNFHVYEGTTRKRRKGVEQKKVDIMIAVDMLNHSFRKNMNRATLLTGDLDFKPLIDALVDNGMFIDLLYPVNKTNTELIQAADSSQELNLEWIYEYSSGIFKKHHYIPSKNIVVGGIPFNSKKIEDVINTSGVKGELFKYNDRDQFILTYLYEPNNDSSFVHLSFNKSEKLIKYFNDFVK